MQNPIPAKKTYRPPKELVEVIDSSYLANYLVHLKVGPQDGKYFGITDVEGTLIFQIRKKLVSVHMGHYLEDSQGNTLVNMRHKIMSMHGRWRVFRGESRDKRDELFTVKRSSIFKGGNNQLDVFLASNSAQEDADFKISGTDGCVEVTLGNSDTIIAEIIAKKDHISVEVHPFVDYAFIASLVVIFLGLKSASSNESSSSFSSAADLTSATFQLGSMFTSS